MKDYTIMCNCGFEAYSKTIVEARKEAKSHLFSNFDGRRLYQHGTHEIYIDRNINNEIDDTFKSIVIK